MDLSKAFDTIRHKTLLEKYARLPINDSIYNWLVNYFLDHKHFTLYEGQRSSTKSINSSVVQGSAIGPISFVVTATDLQTAFNTSKMIKYADDTYIILRGMHAHNRIHEIQNVNEWASKNNLQLNINKTKEIVFTTIRYNKELPPCLPNIQRVEEIKALGITLTSKLRMDQHIDNTLISCNVQLQRIRNLRHHGLPKESLYDVYDMLIKSKIMYASQAWIGLTKESDIKRINGYLNRSQRWGYYRPQNEDTNEFEKRDATLFKSVSEKPDHRLAHLLPPTSQRRYQLRERPHNFQTSTVTPLSYVNFLTRMITNPIYME